MSILDKNKFYSLKNILTKDAQYNMIFGERSNGKTYAVLDYAIKNYCEKHEKLAYVRRWQDDFKGKRAPSLFDGHVSNGVIAKYSNNKWTNVHYTGGRWYLCKYIEEDDKEPKRIVDSEPFAYAFSISSMEHDKSTSYPDITTICFDEFLTRGMYLPDEFVSFCNVISTIVRYRTNVKIFMLGNTVNRYSPYFTEMGLNNVPKMNKGDIDVYTYGESGLKVAVEYSDSPNKKKDSDVYFAFDNPKLQMITGGVWEIDLYPHCPLKYAPKDIIFTYFIIFGNDILQCEIVQVDDNIFTFIHRKTTELKDTDHDLIYSTEHCPRYNWKRKLTKPSNNLERRIYNFFATDKVFYQDNEIGEIVRNYLIWCTNSK